MHYALKRMEKPQLPMPASSMPAVCTRRVSTAELTSGDVASGTAYHAMAACQAESIRTHSASMVIVQMLTSIRWAPGTALE